MESYRSYRMGSILCVRCPEYKGAVYLWLESQTFPDHQRDVGSCTGLKKAVDHAGSSARYGHIKPLHKILDEKYYNTLMTAVQKASLSSDLKVSCDISLRKNVPFCWCA